MFPVTGVAPQVGHVPAFSPGLIMSSLTYVLECVQGKSSVSHMGCVKKFSMRD